MRRTFVLSVAAALVASIAIAVTGVVVSSIHRTSIERGFDERLSGYMRMLAASLASADRRPEALPPSVGEPLFDLRLSGWYWQITALDVSKPGIRSSRSLWDRRLAHLPDEDATTSPGGMRQGYAIGPEGQRLRLLERTVDLGDGGRYLIGVAGDAVEIDEQMWFFQKATAISFGILASLLALIMFFQTRLVQRTLPA
jgi:hypothetical protein